MQSFEYIIKDSVPNLEKWTRVKGRNSPVNPGEVYSSPDGSFFLRTGLPENILQEADFAKEMRRAGFPVPEVKAVGFLPDGKGYFIETSAGERNFSDIMHEEHLKNGLVTLDSFERYITVVLKFLEAQLKPKNIQQGPNQLFIGIQAQNVIDENPEIDSELIHSVIGKAEERTSALPLVLSHGDFNAMNIMEKGVIDFEHRFIAPFGYDAISATTFQRFWDHPKPDGTGNMKRWDITRQQLAEYLSHVDRLCENTGIPALSEYIDDFLTLKSIWALSYERPKVTKGTQPKRWDWRKKVALYCFDQYLAGKPIESESFNFVGLE